MVWWPERAPALPLPLSCDGRCTPNPDRQGEVTSMIRWPERELACIASARSLPPSPSAGPSSSSLSSAAPPAWRHSKHVIRKPYWGFLVREAASHLPPYSFGAPEPA